MKLKDITYDILGTGLKVYFKGTLHCYINRDSLRYVNAWWYPKDFNIELGFNNRGELFLQYEDRRTWVKVLDIINKTLLK